MNKIKLSFIIICCCFASSCSTDPSKPWPFPDATPEQLNAQVMLSGAMLATLHPAPAPTPIAQPQPVFVGGGTRTTCHQVNYQWSGPTLECRSW